MFRYSPPNLGVGWPRATVTASLSEIDRGSYAWPLVEALLVARIRSPLRATPVVPLASIDCEVTVPDSDTCVASYPGGPNAMASYFGRLKPTRTSLMTLVPKSDWWLK